MTKTSAYSKLALIPLLIAVALTGIIYLFNGSLRLSAIIAFGTVLVLLLIFVLAIPMQRSALEQRLAKFDINLKSGRINEANLRRMYHSGGRAQMDALMVYRLAHRCSVAEAKAALEQRNPR